MKCMLVGNYGVANLGDEALKEYFLHAFPDIEWVAVSAHPQGSTEVPRLPGGIRSLLGTRWWKTLQMLRTCDAMVFGGGSLFTDVESRYACVLWSLHAVAAWCYGKPVVLAFQGMGPYKTRTGEWLARFVARRAVLVSVRDHASATRVAAWHLNTKVVQTFDPVFRLMENKKYPKNTKKVFSIIPRHNSGEPLRKTAVEYVSKTPGIEEVQILLMQPDSPEEQAVAEQLRASIPVTSTVRAVRTLDDLMQQVSASSFVLTQRFHGALAALAAGVPQTIVPQGEGDKLSSVVPYAEKRQSTEELTRQIQHGEEAMRQVLMNYAHKRA